MKCQNLTFCELSDHDQGCDKEVRREGGYVMSVVATYCSCCSYSVVVRQAILYFAVKIITKEQREFILEIKSVNYLVVNTFSSKYGSCDQGSCQGRLQSHQVI